MTQPLIDQQGRVRVEHFDHLASIDLLVRDPPPRAGWRASKREVMAGEMMALMDDETHESISVGERTRRRGWIGREA